MDDKIKNDFKIKFRAERFELQSALKHNDYAIGVMGTITDITKKDNNDGSYTYIYNYKPYEIKISSEHEKQIIKVDKRKKSQRMRFAIINLNNTDMNDQDYYEMVMDKIFIKIPEIVKEVLK